MKENQCRLRLRLILILLILIVSSLNIFGQGLNNPYSIDSVDIRNVFNILGVEVFKFPIQKQNEKCNLHITMEHYSNQHLIDSVILNYKFSENMVSINDKDRLLRIYKNRVNDSTIGVVLNLGNVIIFDQFKLEKDTIGMQFCRAYTDFQPEKGKKTPIFIWAAFGKGRTEYMHCPGDSPIESVVEQYDFVIAVFLEIEVKKIENLFDNPYLNPK